MRPLPAAALAALAVGTLLAAPAARPAAAATLPADTARGLPAPHPATRPVSRPGATLPAPRPATRPVPRPVTTDGAGTPEAPHPTGTTPVVVRALDLGEGTHTRGWAPEEDTSAVVTGGSTSWTDAALDVGTGAPADLYRSERWGRFGVTLPHLLPRTTYTVRLHLAETYWWSPGQRVFDVTANGTTVRRGVDVVALAGGPRRAVTLDLRLATDADGTLALGFDPTVDQASVAGIEVLWDQPTAGRDLVPAGGRTRVMVVGDSISTGYGDAGEGGFRGPLWDALTAAGRGVVPVGPATATPWWGPWAGSGYAAWDGWRLDDLLGRGDLNDTGRSIDDWVTDAAPDVVLVHAGNNDVDAHEPTDRIAGELGELVDRITRARPDAHVVVARVINVRGVPQHEISAYDEAVADVVAARAAGGHVHLVDMEPVVASDADYSDGVHPSSAGYHAMARAWADALDRLSGR